MCLFTHSLTHSLTPGVIFPQLVAEVNAKLSDTEEDIHTHSQLCLRLVMKVCTGFLCTGSIHCLLHVVLPKHHMLPCYDCHPTPFPFPLFYLTVLAFSTPSFFSCTALPQCSDVGHVALPEDLHRKWSGFVNVRVLRQRACTHLPAPRILPCSLCYTR